jgi:hypothetical protein
MGYMEEVLRQVMNLDLSRPEAYVTEVAHDDWCNLLAGKGACNCNPEVTIRPISDGAGPGPPREKGWKAFGVGPSAQ